MSTIVNRNSEMISERETEREREREGGERERRERERASQFIYHKFNYI